MAGKLRNTGCGQYYEVALLPTIATTPLRKGGDHPGLLSTIQSNQQHIEKAQGFSEYRDKMETNRYTYTDTRRAEKAGSWYEDDLDKLVPQLNGFFAKVPQTVDDSSLPIPGARIIIAP